MRLEFAVSNPLGVRFRKISKLHPQNKLLSACRSRAIHPTVGGLCLKFFVGPVSKYCFNWSNC